MPRRSQLRSRDNPVGKPRPDRGKVITNDAVTLQTGADVSPSVMEITMRARSMLLCLALSALPSAARAQTAPAPALDLSGVIFGNYQLNTDAAAKARTGGEKPNKFDIARVYLNFRMPAGEKGSIRVTTDVLQNTGGGGYYGGWAIRLKYGFFQYDVTRKLAGVDGLGMQARIGMLQNVIVEHMDSYWPRYLGINAVETHNFFASADVGAATLLTLPKRRGEAYFTVLNGSNYTAAENDRFKDVAGRFSWTPFANDSGFLRTLAITPWYSKGRAAGAFPNGGPGQVGPVTAGIQKDRRGIFAGVRDRRLSGGAEFSQRVEEVEGGLNTAAIPRTVRGRTSNLVSGFAFVRPLEIANATKRSRLGLFTRVDNFDFDDTPAESSTTLAWFGAFWDLNSRATFTLDYQDMKQKLGTVTIPTKTLFMHWVASF